MSAHPLRASLALMVSVALIFTALAVLTIKPAHSQTAGGCVATSTLLGNGAAATCQGGTTGGAANPYPDGTWVIVNDYGQSRTCTNRVGVVTYMVTTYVVLGGVAQPSIYDCLVNYGGPVGVNLDRVKAVAKKPVIKTDYNGDFLIGAEVKFTTAAPGKVYQSAPGGLGTIELVPTKYRWDFGDGSSSTEVSPAHTYQTKPNDAGDLNVSFTVTYQAYLYLGANADTGVQGQDLGQFQLTSNIEKHIVEVWAALTPEAR